jgi:hypothetical protein
LEGFGKLFPDNTKLFVYPERAEDGQPTTFTEVKVPEHLRFLYRHLLENGFVAGIECSDANLFNIYSREVLKQIPTENTEWQAVVPEKAVKEIIDKKMFGYRG